MPPITNSGDKNYMFLSALQNLNKLSSTSNLSTIKTSSVPSSSSTSLNQAISKLPATNKPSSQSNMTFSERLTDTLKHGVNYFTKVRDQAIEDKEKGIKALAGGEKLWQSLLLQAEKIGAKGQNSILENLATETGTLISKEVKGTVFEDLLGSILPGGGSTSATSTTGAATAAGAAGKAGGVATTGVAGSLGSITSGVGAAYSLWQLIDGFGQTSPAQGALHGATVGAYAGSMIAPGIGTVIGGLIGGIGGAISGLFSKKKNPDRIQRDNMRAVLSEIGFTDKQNQVTLSDGSKFSIGMDGKQTLANTDGTTRYGYQLDFSNPLVNKAIAQVQPLAEILTGGGEKLKVDLIGYLVNAATSNAKSEADVSSNIRALYTNSGIAPEKMVSGLAELTKGTKIKEEELKVYINDMTELFKSSPSVSQGNTSMTKESLKIAA